MEISLSFHQWVLETKSRPSGLELSFFTQGANHQPSSSFLFTCSEGAVVSFIATASGLLDGNTVVPLSSGLRCSGFLSSIARGTGTYTGTEMACEQFYV